MKAEFWQRIKDKITKINNDQYTFSEQVLAKPNVNTWTLADLQNWTTKAKDLQRRQDLFLKSDLYHLIGMGKLTVEQMNELLKLTKNLLSKRTLVKIVASLQLLDEFKPKLTTIKTDSVNDCMYVSTLLECKIKADGVEMKPNTSEKK